MALGIRTFGTVNCQAVHVIFIQAHYKFVNDAQQAHMRQVWYVYLHAWATFWINVARPLILVEHVLV